MCELIDRLMCELRLMIRILYDINLYNLGKSNRTEKNNEVNQTTKQDFKNWVGKFLDKRDLNIGHL